MNTYIHHSYNTLSNIVKDTKGNVLGMFTSSIQAKQYRDKLIKQGYNLQ